MNQDFSDHFAPSDCEFVAKRLRKAGLRKEFKGVNLDKK